MSPPRGIFPLSLHAVDQRLLISIKRIQTYRKSCNPLVIYGSLEPTASVEVYVTYIFRFCRWLMPLYFVIYILINISMMGDRSQWALALWALPFDVC